MKEVIERSIEGSSDAMGQAWLDEGFMDSLQEAASAIVSALEAGGKLLAFGNGGSAAQASHFVGELVGRFRTERRPLPAVCLNVDPAVMTAVANDYGYGEAMARQVDALAQPGDVLVGFSTSGRSKNVLTALYGGKDVRRVLFMGAAPMTLPAEIIPVRAPSEVTSEIQEIHLACIHAICAAVDEAMGG